MKWWQYLVLVLFVVSVYLVKTNFFPDDKDVLSGLLKSFEKTLTIDKPLPALKKIALARKVQQQIDDDFYFTYASHGEGFIVSTRTQKEFINEFMFSISQLSESSLTFTGAVFDIQGDIAFAFVNSHVVWTLRDQSSGEKSDSLKVSFKKNDGTWKLSGVEKREQ